MFRTLRCVSDALKGGHTSKHGEASPPRSATALCAFRTRFVAVKTSALRLPWSHGPRTSSCRGAWAAIASEHLSALPTTLHARRGPESLLTFMRARPRDCNSALIEIAVRSACIARTADRRCAYRNR
jgi:hypothetical protein